MTEAWRDIAGFEGYYQVSDLGRVRSFHGRGSAVRLLAATRVSNGYLIVNLRANGVRRGRQLHALVADAFLGPRPAGHEVRHLNGDQLDCRAVNLAYGTHSRNVLDSVEHGTHHEARKTHCPRGHAYDSANTYLYRGKRNCRACKKAQEGRRAARRRASR